MTVKTDKYGEKREGKEKMGVGGCQTELGSSTAGARHMGMGARGETKETRKRGYGGRGMGGEAQWKTERGAGGGRLVGCGCTVGPGWTKGPGVPRAGILGPGGAILGPGGALVAWKDPVLGRTPASKATTVWLAVCNTSQWSSDVGSVPHPS